MGSVDRINPVAGALYFLAVSGIVMFSMNPVILILSLFGAILFFFARRKKTDIKSHLYSLLLFAVMTVINPLVNHNGVTVLFVMNDNPVTLEALIYGGAAAAMIVSVLYWFRSFTDIMTSDKLLYIFGGLSPKLALILSMALRFVPVFTNQIRKTEQVQRGAGLYKDDNILDTFKGKTQIFSIIITWGLENGIITADSMSARGYGYGRRTRFSLFRWQTGDVIFLILMLLLFAASLWGTAAAEFAYYPAVSMSEITAREAVGFTSYGILAFLPTILEVKEALRWKYLKSKI